jgi:flagellar hook-associated protein 2
MSNASSISLSSLGLGSGLNDAQIITTLVAAQQAPVTAMQTHGTAIQAASQTISTFSSDLSALQAAANALSDPMQYSSYTATSSSSAVVATSSAAATPGTYAVQVNALAQAQVTYGNPQASSTAALGLSGTIGITVGGTSYPIAVNSTDSLATIATNISSSGAGVTASVVYDGSKYRLQLQGQSTGAANAMTFTETGLSLGLTTPANTYQAAQDASLTVNNITVTSSSNQVTGAIPGVTMALTATQTAPSNVTVASDPSAISQSITTFVNAYNTMVSAGHAAAGYGTTAASSTLLTGDRGIEGALSQMSGLIAGNIPNTTAGLQNLASVGISLQSNGTLAVNSTTLTSALNSNPSAVRQLFVTDSSTGATGVMSTISNAVTSLTTNATSALRAEAASFTTEQQSLTTQEAAMTARIKQYQTTITAEFASMEQTVQSSKTNWTNLGGTGTFV